MAQQRDRVAARASFEQALELRPMAAAHVNLALICLADGASTAKEEGVSGSMPVSAVLNAKEHCRAAIELNDDAASVKRAELLLGDMATRAA